MAQEQVLVTPFFKTIAVQNIAASKVAGRPIFKDEEHVEVRIAGERNYAPCFPAHSMWKRIDGEEITYAMRWSDQYRRFKENVEQVANGTPLAELPFLTQAKRAELRALKIYTAEALAGLEGRNLKTLGMEGNALKSQAKAYLDKAAGSAETSQMAEQIEILKQQIEDLKAAGIDPDRAVQPPPAEPHNDGGNAFAGFDEEALKSYIAEHSGARPRGNPNRETLIAMAKELEG